MSIIIGTLKGLLELDDNFTNPMMAAEKRFSAAVENMEKVGKGLSTVGLVLSGLSAAFGAVAAVAVSAASTLNASLGNLQAILGGPIEQSTLAVQGLKGEIQTLAPLVGKGTKDLAEGVYELYSALGDTGENMKLLEINAKAATAGMASTQDAIKFTTAVTKTFGDTSAEATQRVADLGFQAVNIGQTTFPELASAIGGVAPLAKETGVSLDEMFAIIATATGVTGNTNEVITQMASAITAIVSPSKAMSEAYEAMGVKSGEALIKQEGLVGAMQAISDQAKKTEKPLIDLVGRKEAWILTSSLAGAQAQNVATNMGKMGQAVGAADKAFEASTQGINKAGFQWEQFKIKVTVAAERLGDAIIPVLVKVGELLLPFVEYVLKAVDVFAKLPAPVQAAGLALAALVASIGPMILLLGQLVVAFSKVAGAAGIGALTTAAPAATGAMVGIGTGATTLTGVLTVLRTAITGLSTGFVALAANPITWVVAAIAGLVVGIRYLTGSWQETWNIVKYGLPFLLALELGYKAVRAALDYLSPAIKAVTSFFSDVYIVISEVVKGALSDLLTILAEIARGALAHFMSQLQLAQDIVKKLWSGVTDLVTASGFLYEGFQTLVTVLTLLIPGFDNFVRGMKMAIEWGKQYWEMLVKAREGLAMLADAMRTEMPKVNGPSMFQVDKPVLESTDALIDRMNKLLPLEKEMRVAVEATARGYGSLSEQLAEMNKVVDKLTTAQKKEIDASLKMGNSSQETADAVNKLNLGVKLTSQVVDIYKDRLATGARNTKDLAAETKKAAETMSDVRAEILKVAAGVEALNDKWIESERELAEKSVDVILKTLDIKIEAEESAARIIREMTMGELQFKLDAMQREGEARKSSIQSVGELAKQAREAIDKDISAGMEKAVRESEEFEAVILTLAGIMPTMFGPAITLIDDFGTKTEKATEKTKTWKEGIRDLSEAFGNLAQSGGALGGFAQFAAQILGAADVAIQSFDRVKVGIADLADKAKGSLGAAFADIASGLIGGVGAMMTATDPSKGLLSRVLGGAVTGAALGAGIAMTVTHFASQFAAAGPWIVAAAAVVGVFVAVFRGRAARREMEIVGAEWGQDISKGLFDKISKSAQFGGDRVAASLFNMKDFISEAGGLDASNVERFMGKFRDVFVMVSTHQFTVAEAQRVINENFGDFAKVSLESGRIASEQFREIIRLNTEMGVNAVAVIDFVSGQTSRVASGLIAIGAPVLEEIQKWEEQVTASQGKLDKLAESGKEGTAEWIAEQEKMNKLAAEHGVLVAKSSGDLDNMGIVAMAAYGAALKAGVGYVQAIKSIGPGLDAIIAAQKTLGITSGNQAVQDLIIFRDKVNQNAALVGAAEALNDTLLAVSHTTGLNADSLKAMEDLGLSTFNKLKEAGFSNNEALRMMGGFLKNVMDAHIDLKIPIDEGIGSLINMASAEGVLKDKAKDFKDVFNDGVTSMVDAINRLIESLNKVPTSVNGIGQALDRVPKQMRVDWEFNIPDIPEGFVPRHSYATGTNGLVDFGSKGSIAVLHNKEAVLTESQYNAVKSPDQRHIGSGVTVSQYNDFRGAYTDDMAGQQRFLKKIEQAFAQSAEMQRMLGN
jgi:TP901 family phage tail tape measure protein